MLTGDPFEKDCLGWFREVAWFMGSSLYAVHDEASVGKVYCRARELTGLHPFDASRLLQGLVEKGFLESNNSGRGTVYCLTGAAIPTPEDVSGRSSPNLEPSSPNNETSSSNLRITRDEDGCLITKQLPLPVIDGLEHLTPSFLMLLQDQAREPRTKRKVERDVLVQVVMTLCTGRFITLSALAELVNREPATLRNQYLTRLVREKRLSLAFPKTPTHARQAYCSKDSLPE